MVFVDSVLVYILFGVLETVVLADCVHLDCNVGLEPVSIQFAAPPSDSVLYIFPSFTRHLNCVPLSALSFELPVRPGACGLLCPLLLPHPSHGGGLTVVNSNAIARCRRRVAGDV